MKKSAFGGFDFYITLFLWLLSFCLCIGIFFVNAKNNVMVKMIKQLIRHGARTEETALKLSDIGIKPTFAAERILTASSMLRRAVKRVGEKQLSYDEYVASLKKKKKKKIKALRAKTEEEKMHTEEEPSFSDAKFFTPKECETDAKRILSKRETSMLQNVLFCIFIISITACLTFLLPTLLDILNKALS